MSFTPGNLDHIPPCQLDTGKAEPYKVDLSFENCAADAARQGLKVHIPQPDELFVDIDSEEAHDFFLRQLPKLEELFGIQTHARAQPSKSGLPHRHIVVTLAEPVSNERRILLQCLLGSDRKRELLSFARCESGNPTPTLFFERSHD